MDSEIGFHKQLNGATELLTNLSIKQKTNQKELLPQKTSPIADSHGNQHEENKARFNKLVQKAKEVGRQGQLEKALSLFEKAYEIHQSEKLERKITKLKETIERYKEEDQEEEEEEEEDDGMREVGDGYSLPAEIHQALYPYQLEGVLWFWRLYKQEKGGILGDDMGLGKTIQVIAFLAGMFDAGLIKSALIVMPVSVIPNWEKEFNTWAPGIRVKPFHGPNKKERLKNLEKIQRRSGVCLTTYGMIVSSHESIGSTSNGDTFTWDYVILDEGHKIKNTTKTSKNIRQIPAKNHFILTGTPVQNNLREMWALFDFVCEGKLLGTSRTFKQEYEGPIVRARERDASSYEKRIGMEMSESLRKLIEPHFLRRTKAMVLEKKKPRVDSTDGGEADKENRPENPVSMPGKLSRKNDLIIWLFMSETQLKIYSEFLGLERVKEMLMSTRSPLAELNVLKKICDHPRLLSTLACEQLGLDEEARLVQMDTEEEHEGSSFATQPKGLGPSDRVLIQESGKMVFLIALLKNLKSEGHRCLIFSQSRKMLDIIQRVITHLGHKILRIDGTISSTAERQHLINTFQTDSSYTCFLLTTQVGGVGITLTAADRVVIFDPSWNPATDAQAVDRVYRIGQKKTVVVYRLITCATLEEKIYRKQIFKDALMKQTTGVSKNPFRYFTRQDMRDLFTLDDPHSSQTQLQLESMHSHHRKTDEQLDTHIKFLKSLDIFGITDHDLMYSQEAVETPDELNEYATDNDAIQARVLRAQNMMAAEAGLSDQNPPAVPATCPRPPRVNPAPLESTALPLGLRQSLPSYMNRDDLSARRKIQAKIDSEMFIIPKPQDTKRFQLKQFAKAVSPAPPPASPDVVDLTTPVRSPPVTSTVEINSESPVDLTGLDERQDGEDLDREFASLHIQHSENVEDDIASRVSSRGFSPNTSTPREICDEVSVRSPPVEESSKIATPKKASKRRKSMSQRIELPVMDDSDEEQFDNQQSSHSAGEGEDATVIPDSRNNSIAVQNETVEEINSSGRELEVELDSMEVVVNQNSYEEADGSYDGNVLGADSVSALPSAIDRSSESINNGIPSSPEDRDPVRRVANDEDEIRDLSESSRESKANGYEDDVIASGDETRNSESEVAVNKFSYEEAEGSDQENVLGADSISSPEPMEDPSSESINRETPSSPDYRAPVRRIADDEDEILDLSESSRETKSSGDDSDVIKNDVTQSGNETRHESEVVERHRGGVGIIVSDDEEDCRVEESEDVLESAPRQRRTRRIVSDDDDSDDSGNSGEELQQYLSPRTEDVEVLDDHKTHSVYDDDERENMDGRSSLGASAVSNPQTGQFLGDEEAVDDQELRSLHSNNDDDEHENEEDTGSSSEQESATLNPQTGQFRGDDEVLDDQELRSIHSDNDDERESEEDTGSRWERPSATLNPQTSQSLGDNEDLGDQELQSIHSDNDDERESEDDTRSRSEPASATLNPQTGQFLSDDEEHEVGDATGSSSETGSHLSSDAGSDDESQSPTSTSSRGECDEQSPESPRATRPRVRRIVSSGDESGEEEGGDGEYAVVEGLGCKRIHSLERSNKGKDEENKSAKRLGRGTRSLSFERRKTSPIAEYNSLPQKKNCCPTGEHVSGVIQIQKCACVVSEEELRKYHMCLDNGRKLELKGRTMDACKQYVSALSLMDSELELHKKVLELTRDHAF